MGSAKTVWELSRLFLAERDGTVVVLKAYLDESGTHEGSPVITVGGYFGRSRPWRNFTKDWNQAKRPIGVFHSADCNGFHGEFEGWSKPDRDKLVAGLLQVIPRHPIAGAVCGVNMKVFEEALSDKPDLRSLFGSPYEACFQFTISTIFEIIQQRNESELVAFVHEENDFKAEALGAFEFVKKIIPTRAKIASLTFGSKADYVPLQAADVLAYEANKRLQHLEGRQRLSLAALDPDGGRLWFGHFGKNNMHKLIGHLERAKQYIEEHGELPAAYAFFNKAASQARGR